MVLKRGHLTTLIKITVAMLLGLCFAFAVASVGHAEEVQVLKDVEINDGDVSIQAYSFNWTIKPKSNVMGNSRFTMFKGSTIDYDFSWTPQPGIVRVGVYNHNTENITWVSSSTSPPLKGRMVINNQGLYSFVIGNDTDTTITASGTYNASP